MIRVRICTTDAGATTVVANLDSPARYPDLRKLFPASAGVGVEHHTVVLQLFHSLGLISADPDPQLET